jgi:hypothetical protein
MEESESLRELEEKCIMHPIFPALSKVLLQVQKLQEQENANAGNNTMNYTFDQLILDEDSSPSQIRIHDFLQRKDLMMMDISYLNVALQEQARLVCNLKKLLDNAERFRYFSLEQKKTLISSIYGPFYDFFHTYFPNDDRRSFSKRMNDTISTHTMNSFPEFQGIRVASPSLELLSQSDSDEQKIMTIVNFSAAGITKNRKRFSKFERFPRSAQKILRTWLYAHFDNPYPNKVEKRELCERCGITMHQLNQWFTNSRMRLWKPSVSKDGQRPPSPPDEEDDD